MSGGAPKGPRMATLEKWNKTREKKDPEFKEQQNQLRQSFFAPVVRTSGNPSTHAGTPACSMQTPHNRARDIGQSIRVFIYIYIYI